MAPSTGFRGICLSKTAASKLTDESIKWAERRSIGIRFNPSDEVLLSHYFLCKVRRPTDNLASQFIKHINVYQFEPSKLSESAYDFGEGKIYFFTTVSKKYPGSKRLIIDRIVPGCGFWKKTGAHSSIDFMDNDVKRKATKTSLAFYKSEQEKTPWLMQEYMLDRQTYEEWGMSDNLLVLCIVYSNDNGKQNQRESENESCDERADMVVASSQILATEASDPKQNSNADWQQDIILSFDDNQDFRRKRLCPSPDPHGLIMPFQHVFENPGYASYHPQFSYSSDPAATSQLRLQFQLPTSNTDMPTLGATDSNMQYPVDPFLEQASHASNGISGECFGPNYQQPSSDNQPDLWEKTSSDVSPWSNVIAVIDLLGQNPEKSVNPNAPVWSPVPPFF